jgi:uncharacterized protein with von Willebrand factor type A (vWA) domain
VIFSDFFFLLRANKLRVTTHEWLLLMRALSEDLAGGSLLDFYHLSRAVLVKSEAYFDIFDQVFAHYFKGVEIPTAVNDDIKRWLDRMPLERFLSPEEIAKLKSLSLEDLQKLFEERLREQDAEHHGGNRWIGTGGTSPFGHGGFHPTGIRVGGQSRNRSAVKIAAERRFQNYRNDLTLDIRQIQLALKKLRELRRDGLHEELDLDETIDKTCRNAGDIDIVFRPGRKNTTRVLLLMDAGGTMDPYADLVSLLFSAAHQSNHFKDFKYYYFHNCVYSRVFEDMERSRGIPTGDLFRLYGHDYKLILVGDAWMHPYELFYTGGAIDFYSNEAEAGIRWLMRLHDHFRKAVWLNPEDRRYWNADTITAIRQIFPMYALTLEGLEEGIRRLKVHEQ